MYDTKIYKFDVARSWPLPLSQTVTLSFSDPSPSSVTFFRPMVGPFMHHALHDVLVAPATAVATIVVVGLGPIYHHHHLQRRRLGPPPPSLPPSPSQPPPVAGESMPLNYPICIIALYFRKNYKFSVPPIICRFSSFSPYFDHEAFTHHDFIRSLRRLLDAPGQLPIFGSLNVWAKKIRIIIINRCC